ncbi:hypothetical protein HanXRQr2_Chr01g0003901 [Helianthus annuus]|uniref:Uncharacterized protein n=1 Tax=Helianthus annuus TaxID=4232 RepID=A0A9K3JSM2_HELAN|nr:hypothetical protein HanXRQr2_Chr01g0003901 [Helianthus annuus]
MHSRTQRIKEEGSNHSGSQANSNKECRLRGLSIFMKNRRIEDRVKSKGCTGRNRLHSLTNIGLEALI